MGKQCFADKVHAHTTHTQHTHTHTQHTHTHTRLNSVRPLTAVAWCRVSTRASGSEASSTGRERWCGPPASRSRASGSRTSSTARASSRLFCAPTPEVSLPYPLVALRGLFATVCRVVSCRVVSCRVVSVDRRVVRVAQVGKWAGGTALER
jgi:hypothetical protein